MKLSKRSRRAGVFVGVLLVGVLLVRWLLSGGASSSSGGASSAKSKATGTDDASLLESAASKLAEEAGDAWADLQAAYDAARDEVSAAVTRWMEPDESGIVASGDTRESQP